MDRSRFFFLSGGDPQGHGQDTRTWLGAMLRIDVNVSNDDLSKDMRYKIPTGNPFSGAPVCIGGFAPTRLLPITRNVAAAAVAATRKFSRGVSEISGAGVLPVVPAIYGRGTPEKAPGKKSI